MDGGRGAVLGGGGGGRNGGGGTEGNGGGSGAGLDGAEVGRVLVGGLLHVVLVLPYM